MDGERCEPRKEPHSTALSQIPDHETRDLVDERSDRFVREHVGTVQDRCVRQPFDGCHADECRKLQVDGAKLIAVSLKIGPDEDVVFAIEGLDVLEAPGARNLLRCSTTCMQWTGSSSIICWASGMDTSVPARASRCRSRSWPSRSASLTTGTSTTSARYPKTG